MKRKLLSMLLALALLLMLLPQAAPIARAEDEPVYSGACGVQGDHLTWRFDPETGTLTIEGYGYMESYWDYEEIPWFAFQSEITALSLPEGLLGIGDLAFSMCPRLTEVHIPESVEYIGGNAFENCSGLTELKIPGKVYHIGYCAFIGCTGLTELTIPGNVQYVSSQAFAFCEGLTELTIQEGVEEISWHAFEGCTGLRAVVLPQSLEYISGFTDCTGLLEVTMNEGPGYIENDAFLGCTGLTSIRIPASVRSIYDNAFRGCTGLTSADIPAGVEWIHQAAFRGCAGLTEVTLPASVLHLEKDALADCESLTAVTFLNPLCDINDSCLEGSNAVTVYGYNRSTAETFASNAAYPFVSLGTTEFTGPCGDSLTWTYDPDTGVLTVSGEGVMWDFCLDETPYREIPWYVVAGQITELRLNEGLTSIGNYAFQNCSGLTSVTIPSGVTDIGYCAFSECCNLTAAELPEGLTHLSGFGGCRSLTDVTIPKSVTFIGSNAFSECELLTEIEIPYGVTYIGWAAFSGCDGLTEVTIPDTVTEVDGYAFGSCGGLTEMTFPESVAEVWACALAECPALTAVTFLNPACMIDSSCLQDSPNVTVYGYSGSSAQIFTEDCGYPFVSLGAAEIGGRCGDDLTWTFEPEAGLFNVEGSGAMWDFEMYDQLPWQPFLSRITAIALPEGLTYIGQAAFQNFCNLTEVVIPGSVDTIGRCAFMDCSLLEKLVISEGVRRIGAEAFEYCSSLSAVTLPASLERVGISAFYGCAALLRVVVRNPACLVCGSERPETRGIWFGYETEYTLGDPEQTVIYGLHDPEKEDAEHIREIEDTPWGPAAYGYRYAENYAKTFGYTFYATNVFEDVKPGKFYEIPVAWAYGRGVTSGVDETHFGPKQDCTRAQVVTFLWNAMGQPEPTITKHPFTDVKEGKFYYNAMLWAYETGVTSGVDETHFGPSQTCTRGQVVTFLWNAMGNPAPTVTEHSFVDVKPGKFYYNAMLWALENGVTAGIDETHFAPGQTCTRGQVVTFLYNTLAP